MEKKKYLPDEGNTDKEVEYEHAKDVIDQQIFPNKWEATLDQDFKGLKKPKK